MKKHFAILVLAAATCIPLTSFAQKTEVFLSLNSGLFSFAGPSAVRTSQINANYQISDPLSKSVTGYTNSTAGSLSGFSYGISSRIQQVTRGNFIVGAGIGYEDLRSKVLIDEVSASPTSETATGKSILSNRFVNASPYLGYRIKMKQVSLDLTAGLDVGYLLKSNEKGEAVTVSGQTITTNRERDWGINFDLRPKVQAAIMYQRFGVYAGYTLGLRNYYNEFDGGNFNAHSRMVRFGATYKIKG